MNTAYIYEIYDLNVLEEWSFKIKNRVKSKTVYIIGQNLKAFFCNVFLDVSMWAAHVQSIYKTLCY